MTVTVAGRAFLAEAKIATTASRRAITAARAANGELAGELIMAVHMGLGARQLPQVLGQLRDRHPKLQVTLHEEPDPADMERLVRQGTLDMVLVHRIPAGCTFDSHPLGEEAYVAVLPKGHPLLPDSAALRLEDLASQGWIRFRLASLLGPGDGPLGRADPQTLERRRRAGGDGRASAVATGEPLCRPPHPGPGRGRPHRGVRSRKRVVHNGWAFWETSGF